MNTHRLATTAAVALGALSASADAATVTLFNDQRSLETSAWAGDPADPARAEEQIHARPGETFDRAIEIGVVSPDRTTVIKTQARQISTLDFEPDGRFELSGTLAAGTSTRFDSAPGGAVVPDGFGYPTSIFDIVLDTSAPIHWELDLHIEARGDAAASFSAFDFTHAVTPFQGEAQSLSMAGAIEAGRYRILADVVAPSDPFFNGSDAEVRFTLRGSAAAVPMPTAFASAGALMAAMLVARRRR